MNRLYIPSKPHPITMKTTTITPSQAKELAEKQTKNPDFTRTFRKSCIFAEHSPNSNAGYEKKYQ